MPRARRLLEDYPIVFAQVKQKAQEGRFIPMGGTWVEMVRCGDGAALARATGRRGLTPCKGGRPPHGAVHQDCNLPCGESLVRQFLYGQRFFEKHFGVRCRYGIAPAGAMTAGATRRGRC